MKLVEYPLSWTVFGKWHSAFPLNCVSMQLKDKVAAASYVCHRMWSFVGQNAISVYNFRTLLNNLFINIFYPTSLLVASYPSDLKL